MASGTRGYATKVRKAREQKQLTVAALVESSGSEDEEASFAKEKSVSFAVRSDEEQEEIEVTEALTQTSTNPPVGESSVASGTAKSPELILSAREKSFIKELRSNTAGDDADVLPTPPAASADETAYASIMGAVSAFSRVHGHCLGLLHLRTRDLRRAVKKELHIAAGWSASQMERVQVPLSNALPKLGEVLLKKPALPVPLSFSAERVVEAYRNILERFLLLTKGSGKSRGKGALPALRANSSSEAEYSVSSGDSSDEDTSVKEVSKAVKWHIKSSEKSLRIGESKYSEEHLYECERLLVEYKRWSDPIDPGAQLKTVPHEVRSFVKKHLATPGAPIMQAYDQPHVKGSPKEQKHVTFLLNKMGYLASRVAKERLSRAGKELDRFGRIRKGAQMSKAERKQSIEGEREWAGLVRWLSGLLAKGVEAYKVFQKFRNADASLAHLLVGAPELSRSSVRRAARAVANCKEVTAKSDSDYYRSGSKNKNGRVKFKKFPKRKAGGGVRITEGGVKKPKTAVRVCWHCNEKGHVTGDCPSAIAGKPPHPKSRFGKSRAKAAKAEERGGEQA